MGGKSGGSQTIGYRYYMSIHMGLCRGPIDELVQINVGDVHAWPIPDGDSETIAGKVTVAQGPDNTGVALWESGAATEVPASEINTISNVGVDSNGLTYGSINAPKLFGGDKKEGGIQGSFTMLWGRASQLVTAGIANLLGGRVPAFRGVATVFYDGMICSLNPYPKTWTFRVRRVTSGWDGAVWQPSLAVIWMQWGRVKAMNPAHIIYEALTNRDWGRGYPRSWLDDAKFTAAAQKLYDEKLGLCLRWTRSSELSEFIQTVVDHIGGYLFVDPSTGLITLELMRTATDGETIPTFGYGSGLLKVEDDETASASDIINEMVVDWNDPILNETRSVRVHNQASLQANGGGVNNSKVSYAGIPDVDLALRIAQRDLSASANSLKRYKVTLDRRAWQITPGRRFRVTAPDRDMSAVIMRVGKITEQSDGSFAVVALPNAIDLPATSYIKAEPVAWNQASRTPLSVGYRLVQEASYRDLVQDLGPADLKTVTPEQAAIVTLAAKPTSMSLGYRINAQPEGGEYEDGGVGAFSVAGLLADAITPHTSAITVDGGLSIFEANFGFALKAGDPVYVGTELCRVTSVSGPLVSIARGCGDTVPRSHPLGELVFFPSGQLDSDHHEYAAGETVNVKLTAFTSSSELALSLAPADTLTLIGRHARPYPPANVRVNGAAFGLSGAVIAPVNLTWVHRNRLIIADRLVSHGEAGTTAEAGTTYTIRVYPSGASTTPVRTVTGITGTAWSYDAAMIAADGVSGTIAVELESVRDGLISTHRYRFSIALA